MPSFIPDRAKFADLARQGRLCFVYREWLADADTPVSLFAKLGRGPYSFLLESVVGGEKVGRYSFLATHPFFEIEAYQERVTISSPSGVSASGATILVSRQFECANPLEELRRRVEGVRAVTLPELPPFCSGAVGYAGYDVVRYFEHLPHAPHDDRQVPDLGFAFYDQMVVFDHVAKTIVVVAMARLNHEGVSRRAAYDDACRRVDALVHELATHPCDLQPVDIALEGSPDLPCQSNFTREQFQSAASARATSSRSCCPSASSGRSAWGP